MRSSLVWITIIALSLFHLMLLPYTPLPTPAEVEKARDILAIAGQDIPDPCQISHSFPPEAELFNRFYAGLADFWGISWVKFRLPAFLFGIGCLFLLLVLSRLLLVGKFFSEALLILLIFDGSFAQQLHRGADENTALFFLLLGSVFAITARAGNWIYFILIGICFSLSLLCLPEMVIPILLILIFASVSVIRRRNWLLALKVGVVVSLTFGLPMLWFSFFPNADLALHLTQTHWHWQGIYSNLNGGIKVFYSNRPWQWPILFTLCIGFLFYLPMLKTWLRQPILWVLFIYLLLFWGLEEDSLLKASLSTPFLYLTLVVLLDFLSRPLPAWLCRLPIFLLVIFNIVSASIGALFVIGTLSERDYKLAEYELKPFVTTEAKFLTDDFFFFSLQDLEATNLPISDYEVDCGSSYEFDYLLVSDEFQQQKPEKYKELMAMVRPEPLLRIDPLIEPSIIETEFLMRISKWGNFRLFTGYNGTLYKSKTSTLPKPEVEL